MRFRIRGLDPAPFRPLFVLDDEALAAHGARRCVADAKPGFPDRVSLCDAEPGETLLLLNYLHQPAATPYRASHAIYVREAAHAAYDGEDEIPPALRTRAISLRAFDAGHLMVGAEIAEGSALQTAIAQLFGDVRVAYLHAHYARYGCYAARVDRVGPGLASA